MRIIWSSESVKDLNKIYDYYVKRSMRVAAIMYNGILDETELLKSQPYIGPIESDLSDFPQTFRFLVVLKGRFKVLYYVKNETINIASVWNCKRSMKNLKKHLNNKSSD